MENRDRLIESGWRQGVLLLPNDDRLKANAHYNITENDQLLIVSQTCDLVQGSFDNEPFFEVLCLHPLNQEPNGNYLGGKNSRRIELSMTLNGDEPSNWCARPFARHPINRELLLTELRPTASIGDQTLKMILDWLARRYTRIAFPEEFVKRIDVQKRPVRKKFDRLNPLVTNVFISLRPFEELKDGEKYTVDLILAMDADTFDDKEKYKECENIKNELECQLNKCIGIEIDSLRVQSTADLTIEDLKTYREWDYRHLSYRDPDNAATPFHT